MGREADCLRTAAASLLPEVAPAPLRLNDTRPIALNRLFSVDDDAVDDDDVVACEAKFVARCRMLLFTRSLSARCFAWNLCMRRIFCFCASSAASAAASTSTTRDLDVPGRERYMERRVEATETGRERGGDEVGEDDLEDDAVFEVEGGSCSEGERRVGGGGEGYFFRLFLCRFLSFNIFKYCFSPGSCECSVA